MDYRYTYFYDCWQNGTITQEELQQAVTKGWISQSEYEQIINSN